MNSVLNPEAPEFFPHLTLVTKWHTARHRCGRPRSQYIPARVWKSYGGYCTVKQTVKHANRMPSTEHLDVYRTSTNYNIITRHISENVVDKENLIVQTEHPAVKLRRIITIKPPFGSALLDFSFPQKSLETEENLQKVVDMNETLLDRAFFNMDKQASLNQPAEGVLGPSFASTSSKPVISKIQVGSTMFIGAKNILRPQLNFKEPVDNSNSLWVPRIFDKPNNIRPLALKILYSEEGVAIGYEHPYKTELELYKPKPLFVEHDELLPFPPPLEETPLTMVYTEKQMDELVSHLCTVRELAVDVEHHSYRTYQGITCLIQITTTEGGDFIVDTLAARDHVHKLNEVFTNPNILKVFHGADSDVLWLQRDFGVYLVGMFDTHQAARALQLSALSFRSLLLRYCNLDADKQFQLADWRIRPLPEELVRYARGDTHHLLYIWRRMRYDLLSMGGTAALLDVFERSRLVCDKTYNKEVVDEVAHLPLYIRSRKSFDARQLSALKLLYKWRDENARELDESPAYLLPNHMLLSLAEILPRDLHGVHACCSPMPPFLKQHLNTVHRMLQSCREMPLEPALYALSGIQPSPHRSLNCLFHDLSAISDSAEMPIDLDMAWSLALEEESPYRCSIPAFEVEPQIHSKLNAEAQLFLPPYERYLKYRELAQVEDNKGNKENEAKITVNGEDKAVHNEEVLIKLQLVKQELEETNEQSPKEEEESNSGPSSGDRNSQRKRKIPLELPKKDIRRSPRVPTPPPAPAPLANTPVRAAAPPPKIPASPYTNANYLKFHSDTSQALKQPKMKFKKRK